MGRFILLVVFVCPACARTLPADRATASLYRDLQRIVLLQQATGWRVDRDEVDDLVPEALMSACRTTKAARDRLTRWLARRIKQLGGPVAQAYRDRGNDLGSVKDLLELTRVQMVHTATTARANDCPFWLRDTETFDGIQLADDRWLLSFGGGGKVIGLYRDDKVDVSFGGAGRIAFGRAFGSRWAWLAGIEFGGSGAFPRSDGEQRGSLVLAFDTAALSIVRYRRINSYIEAEAGYLMHFTDQDARIQPGIHAGIAFGLRAARKEWWLPGAVFPGAAFAVIYERTFPRFGASTIQMLKIGFRGAFDVHR